MRRDCAECHCFEAQPGYAVCLPCMLEKETINTMTWQCHCGRIHTCVFKHWDDYIQKECPCGEYWHKPMRVDDLDIVDIYSHEVPICYPYLTSA